MQHLKNYLSKFSKLKQGITQYGKAPHKPIFLLAVIDEIENGNITENKVFITPEFVATFKDNFSLLVTAPYKSDFIQPFYYLQSEQFWHIQTHSGEALTSFIRSFTRLNEAVAYGYFEEDLFMLLSNTQDRNILKTALLNTYFPDTKAQYLQNKGNGYIQDLQKIILNEKPEPYHRQAQEDEEETFVRGGLFKKLVPQVYGYTCCVSGMKIISQHGYQMIDACHIKPFSISKNDKITNGLSLCPNLHRAFDIGLFSLDDSLKVIVSNAFAEDENNPYSLHKLQGKSITLPFGNMHYPDLDNVRWHREKVFK